MAEKTKYTITVAKNLEKGGAWLAVVKPDNGDSAQCAAWSSAAPAKRWAAQQVGRSRLTWEVSEDKKFMSCILTA